MDGNLFGSQIVPDQMQVINPLMVLVLIPLFDKLLYPLCEKAHLLTNPLHRMVMGGMTAGLAFIGGGPSGQSPEALMPSDGFQLGFWNWCSRGATPICRGRIRGH